MNAVELIVRGNVQRVGYRNIVSQAAFESGIKGFVENLPDESVRIVVQGKKGRLNGFIDRIKIRGWPVNVESIEKKSIAVKEEFKRFSIVRANSQQEMSERADEAALYMHKMYDEMRGTNTSMKGMSADMTGMRAELKGFRADTNDNFCHMDKKYDKMSVKLGGVSPGLNNLSSKLDNVSSKLDNLSSKFDNLASKLDYGNKILKRELNALSSKLDDGNKILKSEFGKLSAALFTFANKITQRQGKAI